VSPSSKSPEKPVMNGDAAPDPAAPAQPSLLRIVPDEEEVKAELARINEMELSDLDDTGFESQREEYAQRNAKRTLEVDGTEVIRRKVRVQILQHTSYNAILTRE
jgi:hypothetical protein